MRNNESAALWYALSLSCILSFSVSSNQAHCLWFPQVGQETAPMGVNGCCHGSFYIYLLVTYLSAILHTCHSSTNCSPRSATTAHKLSVYCACKKQIRCLCASLQGAQGVGRVKMPELQRKTEGILAKTRWQRSQSWVTGRSLAEVA